MKTTDAHSTAELEVFVAMERMADGEDDDTDRWHPASVSAASKTTAGSKQLENSSGKKSVENKSKKKFVKKPKKNVVKPKKAAKSTENAVGFGENFHAVEPNRERQTTKDSESNELYVVQLPGIHSTGVGNSDEPLGSSQGEKLHALADAATIHASIESDPRKTSTAARKGLSPTGDNMAASTSERATPSDL